MREKYLSRKDFASSLPLLFTIVKNEIRRDRLKVVAGKWTSIELACGTGSEKIIRWGTNKAPALESPGTGASLTKRTTF